MVTVCSRRHKLSVMLWMTLLEPDFQKHVYIRVAGRTHCGRQELSDRYMWRLCLQQRIACCSGTVAAGLQKTACCKRNGKYLVNIHTHICTYTRTYIHTYIHTHIEKHVSNRSYRSVTNTLPMWTSILLYVLWFSRWVNGMERMSQTRCASHIFPNLCVVIYTSTVTYVREIMTYWPSR